MDAGIGVDSGAAVHAAVDTAVVDTAAVDTAAVDTVDGGGGPALAPTAAFLQPKDWAFRLLPLQRRTTRRRMHDLPGDRYYDW